MFCALVSNTRSMIIISFLKKKIFFFSEHYFALNHEYCFKIHVYILLYSYFLKYFFNPPIMQMFKNKHNEKYYI